MNAPITETVIWTAEYAVALQPGWNLVSIPVIPNDLSITVILKSQIAANEVLVAWSYTGTPLTWQEFIPGKVEL